MAAKKKTPSYAKLKKFIKLNGEDRLRTSDLADPAANPDFKWTGLKKSDAQLIEQLRQYQRISNVVPAGQSALALQLLEAGMHSALQITAMSLADFLDKYADLHEDPEVLRASYERSVSIRTQLLLQYVNQSQQATARAS
jgi:hypothetical protein